ncbi:vitamin K epoxide reductase family protein [Chryseobacterium aquaticum]|uniref:Vitamin K epoxide reductase domain-containing protein n=1 Tax=Chryseobacterium aquaticum subsp. greenlandense TaxID=345663 RepID=A0A101CJ64_9FLAO|nr:vitamin K epoxide reductase family protein [Chryseobacterium aquaticum]KUJ57218.1 hypothetical protein AR686_06080 [Chryseobacterium aquaticum subsp. greenlandense]
MSTDQNIELFIAYLKSQNILIDFSEFEIQVKTHPDYPSLLSFSDALNFFNIPNIATKVENEEISSLPSSFIALLKDEHGKTFFSFLQRKNEFYHYRKGKQNKKETLEVLKKKWSDVVLLIEKPEDFIDKSSQQNILQSYLIIGLIIFTLALIYWFSNSFITLLFGFISMIGIFLSIEALKTELGIESKVSQTFCGAISNADCGQVINSTKVSWLKNFKISDISIWFFSSQILSLLLFAVAGFSNIFLNYIFLCLILSVPITLYSIYFQYKIEKKWCPICLSIIVIIYLQIILLLQINFEFSLYTKMFILLIFIFIIVAILLSFFKSVFVDRKNLKRDYIKYLRFSKNYKVFKGSLKNSQNEFFTNEIVILGNTEAEKKITVITSPFCGFCENVHETLESILNKYSDQIAISIRFNFYEEAMDDNAKNLLTRLIDIYKNDGGASFMEAMNFWFKNNKYDKWFLKYSKSEESKDIIQFELNEITNENIKKGLSFTPNIFLNQYNYPTYYSRENLEYFIADWIEDEDV